MPFDAKHTTTDYEFRFDQPESPVILDARPNGLLSGKSYYQWKNQQAIPLTDDLFANDSFCMAGLRTKTIGICEKGHRTQYHLPGGGLPLFAHLVGSRKAGALCVH